MAEPRPAQTPTYQLYMLPKEKQLLDFVLRKLSETLSPERYEIIATIFQMYRTSAGFDPSVMSKVRFKRMKAGDFKHALLQIDEEIGQIIQSEAYRQELARLGGPEPLFQSFLEISQLAAVQPVENVMPELESMEMKCSAADAVELLLLFYRQHSRLIESMYEEDEANRFLERYDAHLERFRQLQRQFRLSFEIRMLEHTSETKMNEQEKIENLIQELGTLLTLEQQDSKRTVMISLIIRAAALTNSPAQHIRPYLDFIQDGIEQFFPHQPESRKHILCTLAQYHVDAGPMVRTLWMDEADKIAKSIDNADDKPALRLIRAMIDADSGNYQAAMKQLNEVEHLLHKSNSKSNKVRNLWIRYCEYKTLLSVRNALDGDRDSIGQLEQLQQIANERGQHRQDISVQILEWRGLEHFLKRSYEEAYSCFDRARGYRKGQEQHPWLLIDRYFCSLLKPTESQAEAASIGLVLQEMQEPMYSKVCSDIMKRAAELVSGKEKAKQ